MENVIELRKCVTDFDELERSDLDGGIKISVYSNVDELLEHDIQEKSMEDDTIFSLWIECREKTLTTDIPINNLELFASSVLKQIEIIRKLYGEQIKRQSDMGCIV